MDLWIEGEREVGTETTWVAKAAVYDSSRVVKGETELGQMAAVPIGGTPELEPYRDAFASSVAWLAHLHTLRLTVTVLNNSAISRGAR